MPEGVGAASRDPRDRLRSALPALVAALFVAVGAYLRIRGLSTLLPWGDEFHSLRHWRHDPAEILSIYDDRGSGVALPLLQRVFLDVLGPTLTAARAPALLGGLATLALAYPVGRRLVGAPAAALATAAIAVSPILVFYSHFARAYSLASALALLLALGLHASTESAHRLRWLALAAVAVALLPWVHATAAVVPLAVGAAAVARAVALGESRRRAVEILVCLGLGAIGCLVLYLPALDSAVDFFTHTAGSGAGDRVSVVVALSVLTGSTALAWITLVGAVAGAVGLGISRRTGALLPIAAVFATAIAVWVVSPRGGPFAYARYLLVSLPFALMLVSWLFVAIVERSLVRVPGISTAVALVLGMSAIGVATATSHASPAPSHDGPFAGTYLSLWPLARFDDPWTRSPAFYRMLAQDEEIQRVLEVPMPRSRASLLYRNYYMQHRKETWLGEIGEAAVGGVGIVSLHDAESACASGADVAILHVALELELNGYWEQVYPDGWSWRLPRTFISLARTFEHTPLWFRREGIEPLAQDFDRVFGPAIYRDGLIEVFALDPSICAGRRDRPGAMSQEAAERNR